MANPLNFLGAHQRLIASRRYIPSLMYPTDFDCSPVPRTSHNTVDYLAVPFPYEQLLCRCCGLIEIYHPAQIIAIKGGCRDDMEPSARSAIGVYFATRCTYNVSRRLEEFDHTSQGAELEACRAALKILIRFRKEGYLYLGLPLEVVIIKTDSEYVINGMTDWIFKWKHNGYRDAKGQPVTNPALFQELDAMTLALNDLGVVVLFWHVPREQNLEADALVNAAYAAWDSERGNSKNQHCW